MKENEKQTIEEMRKDLIEIFDEEYEKRRLITPQNTAEKMTAKGYRKQIEGEWIKTETNYTCSKCNFNVISWSGEYDGYECERGISLMKFCPNCGAHMKGENDERAN